MNFGFRWLRWLGALMLFTFLDFWTRYFNRNIVATWGLLFRRISQQIIFTLADSCQYKFGDIVSFVLSLIVLINFSKHLTQTDNHGTLMIENKRKEFSLVFSEGKPRAQQIVFVSDLAKCNWIESTHEINVIHVKNTFFQRGF